MNSNITNGPEPIIITEQHGKRSYIKGRFLGKGGFAKCFELKDLDTGEIFAGKIVPKASLIKPRAKRKLGTEIKIHRSLVHPHIVRFKRFFEDHENVYLLLELCNHKTMMDMLKRRQKLPEAEVRYWILQVLSAIEYLHKKRVIHRDLKLGNLFIHDMNIKIGDFGLAAKLESDEEHRRTICGTPNYIAPEVLDNKGDGHSYQVDIWSLGVVLYTLLFGRPPFETSNVKTTYRRIKATSYSFPENCSVSKHAQALIRSILTSVPECRPTVSEIMNHEFFAEHACPTFLAEEALIQTVALPTTPKCFVRSPRLPTKSKCFKKSPKGSPAEAFSSQRFSYSRPLGLKARDIPAPAQLQPPSRPQNTAHSDKAPLSSKENTKPNSAIPQPESQRRVGAGSDNSSDENELAVVRKYLSRSMDTLGLIQEGPQAFAPSHDMLFVVKWVDYSSKYGLGYQLSTGVIGAYFNDATKVVAHPSNSTFDYLSVDSKGQDDHSQLSFQSSERSHDLEKKVTLLKYFCNIFGTPLGSKQNCGTVSLSNKLLYVKRWLRSKHAIIFRLNTNTVQVNFFDHSKLILSSEGQVVTYVNKHRETTTGALSNLMMNHPSKDLVTRLKYTKEIMPHLVPGKEKNPSK